ncbi:hypothetical protein BH11CYA1_BH11CYA1_47230 [soil metagenome]
MERFKFSPCKTDLQLIVTAVALTSFTVAVFFMGCLPACSSTAAERVKDALEAGDAAFVDAKYQVALNDYQAAANNLRKSGNKGELIECLTKIAGTALKLNDHGKAKVALIEAVGICISTKDFSISETTSAYPVNMLLKEYDRDKNLNAIQTLCENLNAAAFVRLNGANLESSDKWLEDVYRKRKMNTQLEQHYLKEIARLKKINNPYLFYNAQLYDGLGRIYLESNRIPQAKDAFTKAIRIDQSSFNWSMAKQLTSSYQGLARCAELMHDTALVKRIQLVLANITAPDHKSSFPLQKFYDLTNGALKLPPGEAIAKLEEARAILRQFYIFDVVLDAELDVKVAVLYSAQGKDKESKLAFDHSMAVLDGLEKAGLAKNKFVRLTLASIYINALNKQGKQKLAVQYADLITKLKADTERQTRVGLPQVPIQVK